jgi:hypothetical protein
VEDTDKEHLLVEQTLLGLLHLEMQHQTHLILELVVVALVALVATLVLQEKVLFFQ